MIADFAGFVIWMFVTVDVQCAEGLSDEQAATAWLGLAPNSCNNREWRAHLRARLQSQFAISAGTAPAHCRG
jgi:hypothetical protein